MKMPKHASAILHAEIRNVVLNIAASDVFFKKNIKI